MPHLVLCLKIKTGLVIEIFNISSNCALSVKATQFIFMLFSSLSAPLKKLSNNPILIVLSLDCKFNDNLLKRQNVVTILNLYDKLAYLKSFIEVEYSLTANNITTIKLNVMDFNKFTIKTQEAVQQAQQIAQSYGHQQIENSHILKYRFA
jgi:hypothetical protein